jgi:predicted  nucleic acid-binding Zn-ribbon protein
MRGIEAFPNRHNGFSDLNKEAEALKESMKSLIELQECDNRIRRIQTWKNEAPRKITAIEEELHAAQAEFQEDTLQLEALKKEKRKIELELQDLESKIARSGLKLSQIKSNKEYQAALKEIEDLKAMQFSTEDRILQIMEAIDASEKRCQANRIKQKGLEQKVEHEKKLIFEELSKLDMELEGLERERVTFCGLVDRDLLKRYDFLKERKGGQAVSAVIRGICQTCHMNLPPQKFNELLKGNALMACPFCQRIIYWEAEEPPAEAKE